MILWVTSGDVEYILAGSPSLSLSFALAPLRFLGTGILVQVYPDRVRAGMEKELNTRYRASESTRRKPK
jgi:hypothetical protein